MSMQIVGRAFDEQTVLRAGAAFEAETGFCKRHPLLDLLPPGPIPVAPTEPVPLPDASMSAWIDRSLGHAGLTLDPETLSLVHAAAPLVEAMIGRMTTIDSWSDEPAQVFRVR